MPMEGLMWQVDDWHLMVHGLANAVYDHQGGPRGDSKGFSNSMLMLMGDRPLGPGILSLRAMLSLDPAMGRAGYPLLLQTGEPALGPPSFMHRLSGMRIP